MIRWCVLPPPKPWAAPYFHGQAVVEHVMGAALVDHVAPERAFDALVQRGRVVWAAQVDPVRRAFVVVIVRILEGVHRPLFPAADLAVVEDDVAHVHGQGVGDIDRDGVDGERLEFEDGPGRKNPAQVDMDVRGVGCAGDRKPGVEVIPLGANLPAVGIGRGECGPWRGVLLQGHAGQREGLGAARAETHLEKRALLHRQCRPPELHVVRGGPAVLARETKRPARVRILRAHGHVRARLLVPPPRALAQVEHLPARGVFRGQRSPNIALDGYPVPGQIARHGAEQQRLRSLAVRGVGDGRARFAAGRLEGAAPDAAALEAHRIARLEIGGIDPVQAAPGLPLGEPVRIVPARLGIDVVGAWGLGVCRAKREARKNRKDTPGPEDKTGMPPKSIGFCAVVHGFLSHGCAVHRAPLHRLSEDPKHSTVRRSAAASKKFLERSVRRKNGNVGAVSVTLPGT